jgi:colanic acid/amylovoran biosynthesis glycosyltransferase
LLPLEEVNSIITMLAIAAPSFDLPSETFIRDHARAIAPGHTVLICNRSDSTEVLGCPVLSGVPAPFPAWTTLSERVRNAIRFRYKHYVRFDLDRADKARTVAFLKEHRVDALLVEYLNYAVLFSSAAEKAGVPLFAHAHGYDASMLAGEAVWRRRYRRLFASAAGVIAPSQFLADRIARLGCPSNRLNVNPCGVDPQAFGPSSYNRHRFLAVGRFVEKKAPQHTVSAFARVAAKTPTAALDFIGDGHLLEECRNLAKQLAVADKVHFHGAQPFETVRKFMSQASIFLQHSVMSKSGDCEGLPVAILEAMASALPVVSTRHSGIPEAVLDGETGLLVDEHDVEGMAAAILRLLSDPGHLRAMGEAGRRRVISHYAHALTTERLCSILKLEPAVEGNALPRQV